jgi:hypothetical protein
MRASAKLKFQLSYFSFQLFFPNAHQRESVISTLPSAMPVCGVAGFFGSRYRS